MKYKVMIRPISTNVALGLSDWEITHEPGKMSSYSTDRNDFCVFDDREAALNAVSVVKEFFAPHKIYLRKFI